MTNQITLVRRIGFPLLFLYGLGTILGAGIYVLVGKVAGEAGLLAPLSFAVAAVIAWLTALSYGQLAVLFPRSAGEAAYVEAGFGLRWLTISIGLLITFTGIVSAAALIRGFLGYVQVLFPVDDVVGLLLMLAVLTLLAAWGIAESLFAAAMITLIEVAGLALVLYYSGDVLMKLPTQFEQVLIPTNTLEIVGVLSGAFLAFYAFIGFEDMVNIVEEVKEPQKQMPRAIMAAITVSTALYILIALVAVLSLPLDQLVSSNAPLATIIANRTTTGVQVLALISIFAIVNGVLIQMIMASRVIYGMSSQYGGPNWLHRINAKTRTPLIATLLVSVLIALFAMFLPLVQLAKLSSFVVLIVFCLVNFSALRLHWDARYQSRIKGRSYPLLAGVLCLAMLLFQVLSN